MKMLKSAILNAVLAAIYIIAVVFVMDHAGKVASDAGLIAPITFLSLFSLSVAVMGTLFLLQPIQLYLANKKKDAVTFFFQTLAAFAVLTLAIVLVLFSGITNL
jgi:hypothetical protein